MPGSAQGHGHHIKSHKLWDPEEADCSTLNPWVMGFQHYNVKKDMSHLNYLYYQKLIIYFSDNDITYYNLYNVLQY